MKSKIFIIGLSICLVYCLFNEMYMVGFCVGFLLFFLIARWLSYYEDKYI